MADPLSNVDQTHTPATTPDAHSTWGGIIAWLAIALVVGMLVISTFLAGQPPAAKSAEPGSAQTSAAPDAPNLAPPTIVPPTIPPPTVAPPGGMLLRVTPMVLVSPAHERPAAIKQLDMFAGPPADKLRLIMLNFGAGDKADADAALKRFEPIEQSLAAGSLLRADTQAVRELLATGKPESLSRSQRDELISRHGLFAHIALDPPTSPELLAAAESGRTLLAMFVGIMVAFAVGLIVAVALSITAIVLIATGSLTMHMPRPMPDPQGRTGTIYLETFALFVVSFAVFSLLLDLSGAGAVLSSAARWLLLLPALWPLARGKTFAALRHDLGWTSGPQTTLAKYRSLRIVREIGLGLLGYFALLPILAIGLVCTLILGAILTFLGGAGPNAHPLGDLIANGTTLDRILLVTLAVGWAPIVEETFFRGALLRHLYGKVPFFAAVALCALIFAAMHPQGLAGIPVLAAAAVNFCLLRKWRGGLIAPITGHALNNGTVVAIVLAISLS